LREGAGQYQKSKTSGCTQQRETHSGLFCRDRSRSAFFLDEEDEELCRLCGAGVF
jgi:hypothetical protein